MEKSSDAERREWDATMRWTMVFLVPVGVFFGLRFFLLGQAGPVVADSAVYMALAKAVADGEGYYEIWRPVPVPHTYYPPGYPALMAALWKLWPKFPDNLLAAQLTSFVSSLIFLWRSQWLCLRYLRLKGWQVALAGLVFATNYVAGLSAFGVGADTLSVLIIIETVMLCTVMIEGMESGRRELLRGAGLSALITIGIYLRSINVDLLVGCVFALLVARRLLVAGLILLSQLVLQGPWILWVAIYGRSSSYVANWLSMVNGASNLFEVMWNNGVALLLEWIPRSTSTLFVSEQVCSGLARVLPFPLSPRAACSPFAIGLSVLTILGLAMLLGRSRCFTLTGVLGGLAVIVLLWPATGGESITGGHAPRFLLPAMLFLIAGAILTVTRICEKVWPSTRVPALVTALFVLLAAVPNAAQTLYYSVPMREDIPILAISRQIQADTEDLLRWARRHTPEEAVMVSLGATRVAPSFYLYSGRQALDACIDSRGGVLAGFVPRGRPVYYVTWGKSPPLSRPTAGFLHMRGSAAGWTVSYQTQRDVARVYVPSDGGEGTLPPGLCPPMRPI